MFHNDHTEINQRAGIIPELATCSGPVLEIWEGSCDRSRNSGRRIFRRVDYSAFAVLPRERAGNGVLHIGMDAENPTRNRTKMSRTRAELLANTGSRDAPASACDSLHLIESAPAKCVFVGQPSEVTALRKAQQLRSRLNEKLGLAISFFCAGSPARKGLLELLRSMRIEPDRVQNIRYRGKGWPGHFSVTLKGETKPARQMTYKESWAFVQAYRPLSTHLCPGWGTGEDADISCGDPWYQQVREGEPGLSLVVIRTETGRNILRGAMEAGYVESAPAEPWKLLESQKNLMAKRGAIGGRIAVMKSRGLPVPRLRGFSLFEELASA